MSKLISTPILPQQPAQRLVAALVTSVLLGGFLLLCAACFGGPPKPNLPANNGWTVFSSPNPGSVLNGLNAVAAVSADNIWTMGTFSNDGSREQALIEHWNGTQWSVVPGPNPGSASNVLTAVAALSASDIWAVGYFSNTADSPGNIFTGTRTFIEHWDGSHWSMVPSPNPGSAVNVLSGIAAVSADDIWAVGTSADSPFSRDVPTIGQTLALHWNGKRWSIARTPNTGSMRNVLSGVAAASAHDVWAVGYAFGVGKQPLIEHWNGKQWSIAPGAGADYSTLAAVAVASPNDVWAVGDSSAQEETLIEHWDGSRWNIATNGNPATNKNFLSGITVISTNDIWAVGASPGIYPQKGQPLIEHWNGTQWNFISSPSPAQTTNTYLTGVVWIPHSNKLWVVGYSGSGAPERTIIEAYSL